MEYQSMTCGAVRITAAKLRTNLNLKPNPREDLEVNPGAGTRGLAGPAVPQVPVLVPLALAAEAGETVTRDPGPGGAGDDILGPPAAPGQGLALGEEEEGRGLGQVAQAAVGLGLVTEDPMDEGIGQGTGGIS